jgi:transposase
MKIAGLDICKGYAVAWILDEFPADPRKFYKSEVKSRSRTPDKDSYTFRFCHDIYEKVIKPGTKATKINSETLLTRGIDTFLSWGVEAVCMEPTGMFYSAFIAKVCEHHNIKVIWVNHSKCKAFRIENEMHDKTDMADAFALACFAQLHLPRLESSSYFIRFESHLIPDLRRLYMAHKFFTRQDTQCLNRIQQHLSYEFPEIDLFKKPLGQSDQTDNRRPLICIIAGVDRDSSRRSNWVKRLKDSIAKEYGIDISEITKLIAGDIDRLDLRLMDIEQQMKSIIYDFPVYNQVFDQFKIGFIHRAILLCLIYPFSSRFDNPASFKRRLGLVTVEEQSGKKTAQKKGSSSALCRREWYLWVSATMKLAPEFRSNAEVLQPIFEYHDRVNASFSNDPDKLQKLLSDKYKDKIKAKMIASIPPELPLAARKLVIASLDFENLTVPESAISKGFGNLVIMKTAGYASKKLYFALDAVRGELD